MKKRTIIYFLALIWLVLFYSYKNPEKPEPPKPAARIEVEAQNVPVYFYYVSWGNHWYCNYTVMISEHNGVGANVTTIRTECKIGTKIIATLTEGGGYLRPNRHLGSRLSHRNYRKARDHDNHGKRNRCQRPFI